MNNKNIRMELSDMFFEQMKITRKIENELIGNGCADIEYFDGQNPALWISLVKPSLSGLSHEAYLDRIDDMPDFAVAALLESKLSSLALNPLQMQGCTIQIEGNSAHFQISASISLNEAKEYLESLRMPTHH